MKENYTIGTILKTCKTIYNVDIHVNIYVDIHSIFILKKKKIGKIYIYCRSATAFSDGEQKSRPRRSKMGT